MRLTLRSSRLAPAWHLAREAASLIIRLAGQAPHLRSRLSSNVRHRRQESCNQLYSFAGSSGAGAPGFKQQGDAAAAFVSLCIEQSDSAASQPAERRVRHHHRQGQRASCSQLRYLSRPAFVANHSPNANSEGTPQAIHRRGAAIGCASERDQCRTLPPVTGSKPKQCCLTLRSSRLAPAWHLAREASSLIIRLAGQAPHLRSRLSSNVRQHSREATSVPKSESHALGKSKARHASTEHGRAKIQARTPERLQPDSSAISRLANTAGSAGTSEANALEGSARSSCGPNPFKPTSALGRRPPSCKARVVWALLSLVLGRSRHPARFQAEGPPTSFHGSRPNSLQQSSTGARSTRHASTSKAATRSRLDPWARSMLGSSSRWRPTHQLGPRRTEPNCSTRGCAQRKWKVSLTLRSSRLAPAWHLAREAARTYPPPRGPSATPALAAQLKR